MKKLIIMMMKKLIVILITVFSLVGCGTLKTVKLMKSGEVSPKEFSEKIPFEYRLGLIILKVKIKGEEFDFVLDTGAPNVISTELAQKLNLTTKSTLTVGDSQNNESEQKLVQLDKLSIGNIDFTNTGAVISDINTSQEVRCLKIDGFIGSNLMRKAIWKFDYQNKVITITNSMNSLELSGNLTRIPFFTELTGTPLCDILVNGKLEKNVVIDLGSNGDITLSNKTYEKVIKESNNIKELSIYGRTASGLYGTGIVDTTKYIIASNITFGDITLKNQIIEFSKGSSTIGMNFFKNYNLVINWNTKEILLDKVNNYDFSSITGFGFSWIYNNNKLIIGSITKGSPAETIGLKLGDEIVAMNDDDFTQMNSDKWCEMLQSYSINTKEIRLTILRQGKKLSYTLKETSFE